jgi:hypothetical protein
MLYLFFNADLIEDCHVQTHNTEAVGWVDDGNIVTWGTTTEENCRNLEAIYEKCQEREPKHVSKFNPSKFSLIHLPSTHMKNVNMDSSVQLGGPEVKQLTKCRILGLILDSKLSWDSHIECIEAKTTKSLEGLSSLEMAQTHDNQEVTIFLDSQATIQLIDGPHTTGQQIISSIIQE